jgi:plastocyanin
VTVTITADHRFQPDHVTVDAGQAVLWKNEDRSPHTVTDDPARASDKSHAALPNGAESFDSGPLNHGDSYSQAFRVPGDYVYFSMTFEGRGAVGRVTVR